MGLLKDIVTDAVSNSVTKVAVSAAAIAATAGIEAVDAVNKKIKENKENKLFNNMHKRKYKYHMLIRKPNVTNSSLVVVDENEELLFIINSNLLKFNKSVTLSSNNNIPLIKIEKVTSLFSNRKTTYNVTFGNSNHKDTIIYYGQTGTFKSSFNNWVLRKKIHKIHIHDKEKTIADIVPERLIEDNVVFIDFDNEEDIFNILAFALCSLEKF